MKDYAAYIIDFNPENIKTGIVPGEDKKTTAWFFVPDQKELKKTIFDLFVFSDDIRKVEFGKKEEGEASNKTDEKKTEPKKVDKESNTNNKEKKVKRR